MRVNVAGGLDGWDDEYVIKWMAGTKPQRDEAQHTFEEQQREQKEREEQEAVERESQAEESDRACRFGPNDGVCPCQRSAVDSVHSGDGVGEMSLSSLSNRCVVWHNRSPHTYDAYPPYPSPQLLVAHTPFPALLPSLLLLTSGSIYTQINSLQHDGIAAVPCLTKNNGSLSRRPNQSRPRHADRAVGLIHLERITPWQERVPSVGGYNDKKNKEQVTFNRRPANTTNEVRNACMPPPSLLSYNVACPYQANAR